MRVRARGSLKQARHSDRCGDRHRSVAGAMRRFEDVLGDRRVEGDGDRLVDCSEVETKGRLVELPALDGSGCPGRDGSPPVQSRARMAEPAW